MPHRQAQEDYVFLRTDQRRLAWYWRVRFVGVLLPVGWWAVQDLSPVVVFMGGFVSCALLWRLSSALARLELRIAAAKRDR